jgi:transposase
MAQTVCVVVFAADHAPLAAIVADRHQRQKHVARARIGLASADRGSAQRVAQSIGVSRPTVWRWQQRFAEAGIEGLLRDKTRKPGKPPIAADKAAQVVALTCCEPPHQVTHWTGRAMATAMALSLRSVQRIWRAHQLPPHRLRTFKRSRFCMRAAHCRKWTCRRGPLTSWPSSRRKSGRPPRASRRFRKPSPGRRAR